MNLMTVDMRESEIIEFGFRSEIKYLNFFSYEVVACELKPSQIL